MIIPTGLFRDDKTCRHRIGMSNNVWVKKSFEEEYNFLVKKFFHK